MLRTLLALFVVSVFTVSCSQNSKKTAGTPLSDLSKEAPASTKTDTNNPHENDMGFSKPTNSSVLLPEIDKKYSGVKISVQDVKTAKEKASATIPFKTKTAIKSTPFEIEVESFFTNFTMDNTGVINKSMEESNPAAKIKVYKAGNVVFDGWLFQNFPDVHQFDDPEFALFLISGSKK